MKSQREVSTPEYFNDSYAREPLNCIDGVPVFSLLNEYQENYEQISKDHLQVVESTGVNPFMDPHLWEEIEDHTVEIFKKYVGNSGKILDVGVGTGRLLSKIAGDFEKYGVDISMTYLKLAAKKNIRVCMSFVEDLPYESSCFDAVVSTDVLEHVLDLNVAVREMLRVLRPGGLLVVRVPYRESLKSYLSIDYKYVHLRNFDEYSLILFFEKIMGCSVLEYKTSGGLITREHLKEEWWNFPKVLLFLAVHATKYLSPKLWRYLANRVYPHSEITVVVRKPSASS
jgi:ubiquinone/menaquinone biosynthesis C-methylase UbiE